MKRYLVFCHYAYDSTELMGQSNDLDVAKAYSDREGGDAWYIIDMKDLTTHYNNYSSNGWQTMKSEVKDLDAEDVQ